MSEAAGIRERQTGRESPVRGSRKRGRACRFGVGRRLASSLNDFPDAAFARVFHSALGHRQPTLRESMEFRERFIAPY